MQTIKPPRLNRGDVIGIVAPASPPSSPEKIERGAAYIETMGFRTVIGKHARDADGYLAGSDDHRAEDLNAMFADPKIRAIFAARGGYGTPRILDRLDYESIRRNPKIFVGYSDCTALQCAIFTRTGLVTFSGPMVAVEMQEKMDSFTEENFWPLLCEPAPRRTLPRPPAPGLTLLRGGLGEGVLMGGNCTLLAALAGTPFMPAVDRTILFLEEIGEKPYRIDRLLAQLRLAGLLRRAAGVMLGTFSGCEAASADGPSLSLDRIFSDYFSGVAGPVIGNFPYGHQPSKLTIPFGVSARVNTSAMTVELTENTVAETFG